MAAFRGNIELLAQAAKILMTSFDGGYNLTSGNVFTGT